MPARVLVIDDSLPLLGAVREALEAAGYSVETSAQPMQMALNLGSLRPDLVLLDVEMPEVKGTDVLATLKANAGEIDAWVALFSSRSEEDLVRLTAEVGAQGWIRKSNPFSPGRLAREVRRLLLERKASASRPATAAMVVDDSRAMRHILRTALEEASFEVAEAGHGVEALAQIAQRGGPPALMLVDLNMPEMNGYDLVVALRQRYADAATKILMVTSETDRQRIAEALEAGADEYLMKPFTREGLLEKLACLGSHRAP